MGEPGVLQSTRLQRVGTTTAIPAPPTTNLIKQQQDLRGLTPRLKEVLLWDKWYQRASPVTEKLFMKGRLDQSSYFKNSPRPPQPSSATTLISQQPPPSRPEPPPAKRL